MAHRRDEEQAIFIISVAAELAGVHPQTLRVYERKGLLHPYRTSGNTRRYSQRDIERLRRIQKLTQEGINLAGVMRIMELENKLEDLRALHEGVTAEINALHAAIADERSARERNALVPLRDVRRVRRAMKSDIVDQAVKRRTFPAPPVG